MICQHDQKWLAYENPVDCNSQLFCVFCELERLRFEAQKHQLQSHILKEAFERMREELQAAVDQQTPDAWEDLK